MIFIKIQWDHRIKHINKTLHGHITLPIVIFNNIIDSDFTKLFATDLFIRELYKTLEIKLGEYQHDGKTYNIMVNNRDMYINEFNIYEKEEMNELNYDDFFNYLVEALNKTTNFKITKNLSGLKPYEVANMLMRNYIAHDVSTMCKAK